ncbi:10112_t:CDS:2, partial [Paraglomus brasilianum]
QTKQREESDDSLEEGELRIEEPSVPTPKNTPPRDRSSQIRTVPHTPEANQVALRKTRSDEALNLKQKGKEPEQLFVPQPLVRQKKKVPAAKPVPPVNPAPVPLPVPQVQPALQNDDEADELAHVTYPVFNGPNPRNWFTANNNISVELSTLGKVTIQ